MEQLQIKSPDNDTIAAIATPKGIGGLAVIRISGPDAIKIVNKAWKGCDLDKAKSHTAHLGIYFDCSHHQLDEAVATIFRSPASFTGEDTVEISLHGSQWIQKEVLTDLIRRGIRIANPGEFTQRAFLNGRLDLAQAEGVADLIAASSKTAHDLAISQLKGKFSSIFNSLREKLIEFASLLELELDFSEEDVEFADRTQLIDLCTEILTLIKNLADSFSRGSALKDGVPVVIAGIPNAGKSSLLNLLLEDEKAIVTDIPGTTRDIIEDTIEIDGILYRFIDTAGLRKTNDIVEEIGVKKAYGALQKASLIIWMIDGSQPLESQLSSLEEYCSSHSSKKIIPLLSKSDLNNFAETDIFSEFTTRFKGIDMPVKFSSVTKEGYNKLLTLLNFHAKEGQNPESDIIITNARHYDALVKAAESLKRALEALQKGISGDFIAQDIRESISHLGSLTGEITSTTLLHSIFSRFCIGK